MSVAAVVLAAGEASRFGGPKLLARLDGRALVAHVVDAARAAGLDPIVVVAPPTRELDELDLGAVRRITNESPQEGLSGSVRLGLRELGLEAGVTGAVILPGDQPRVRPAVIRAVIDAAAGSPEIPFLVPQYADDGAPNPVFARRAIWRLADELAGDHGFGPLLAAHPELVRHVPVEGSNPDVDTPGDLARLAKAAGAARDVS